MNKLYDNTHDNSMTSQYGPKLTFTEDLTKQNFMLLCNSMSKALGREITPARVREGGWAVAGRPEESIRLWVADCEWPQVNENWAHDTGVLIPKGKVAESVLFKGTWSLNDMIEFAFQMRPFGIETHWLS